MEKEATLRTVLVRYRTTPAHAAANAENIRAVFAELAARAPAGFHYASFRVGDSDAFVHIATHDAPGENPLLQLASFKHFQAQLKERCVESPVVTELEPVGAYAFGGLA
jgi:hypothetical protein